MRDLDYMPSNFLRPEIIEGRGQYRAGRGQIVTDWCETKEQAIKDYWRMVREQQELT